VAVVVVSEVQISTSIYSSFGDSRSTRSMGGLMLGKYPLSTSFVLTRPTSPPINTELGIARRMILSYPSLPNQVLCFLSSQQCLKAHRCS